MSSAFLFNCLTYCSLKAQGSNLRIGPVSAPTIRSVAKVAKVSTATVSMAMRNDPRITLEVREHVQKLAKKCGYQINPVVSRLLSQMRSNQSAARQGILGFLSTSSHSEDASCAFTKTWLASARQRAEELGFWLDEFALHEKELSPGRLLEILEARNIRGLMLAGPFLDHSIPRDLYDILGRSSVVVVGERTSKPALDCVLNDQFLTTSDAVAKCLASGYRRPGLCIHPDLDGVVENRFSAGFLVSQRQLPADRQIPEHPYQARGEKDFVAWVRRYHPDVILTLHPEIKIWLEKMGTPSPQSIGLVHLDRTKELTGWSGMKQDHEHLGTAAVEMLINHLFHNEVGIPPFQRCLFLGSRWVEGRTTLRLASSREATSKPGGTGKPSTRNETTQRRKSP